MNSLATWIFFHPECLDRVVALLNEWFQGAMASEETIFQMHKKGGGVWTWMWWPNLELRWERDPTSGSTSGWGFLDLV